MQASRVQVKWHLIKIKMDDCGLFRNFKEIILLLDLKPCVHIFAVWSALASVAMMAQNLSSLGEKRSKSTILKGKIKSSQNNKIKMLW